VKGATDLTKETRLMRNRVDKVLECFQHTVVSAAQSQTTKLESAQAENKQLQWQIRELEIENLKQASELEDCDELMVAMEERRLSMKKETSRMKEECESLTDEVAFLKETMEVYNHTDVAKSAIQKEELVVFENESLKKELSAKDDTIRDLVKELENLKIFLFGNKENNDNNDNNNNNNNNTSSDDSPSLIVESQKAGMGAPSSLFRKKKENHHDRNNTSDTASDHGASLGSSKSSTDTNMTSSSRRRSLHRMSLRGNRTNQKYEF